MTEEMSRSALRRVHKEEVQKKRALVLHRLQIRRMISEKNQKTEMKTKV